MGNRRQSKAVEGVWQRCRKSEEGRISFVVVLASGARFVTPSLLSVRSWLSTCLAMGGSNTKEKPKEKEKRDQARVLRAIENALETGATRLDLNNRHIRELPELFEGKRDALKWLSLSHNELRTLSDSVCQFVSLTALRLNGNFLSSLPDAISALTGLQVLDLSKNKFTEWDAHITAMTQLTDLNLQCNQIGSVRPPPLHPSLHLHYSPVPKNTRFHCDTHFASFKTI